MAKKQNENGIKPQTLIDAKEFHALPGTEFGGGLNVLSLEVGEGGVFIFRGSREIKTEFGAATSITAENDGQVFAMPLSKIFMSNFKDAGIQIGQKFAVLREADRVGTKGMSKGKTMENYIVKPIA